ATALLVPFREGRGHLHLLDDLAPADAGVVGAEADLALLRRVRDDAHLGAAEVVVEKILEPHPGDEKHIPAVVASPLYVLQGPVGPDLAVIAPARAEALVELHQQAPEVEMRGGLERVESPVHGPGHTKNR